MDVETLLLKDFLDEFMYAYNFSSEIIGYLPEQANTEVKSALVHLARAQSALSNEDKNIQLKQASDHLKRGKRDCYKLAIAQLIDDIGFNINDIEECYGKIPIEIIGALRQHEILRRNLYSCESRGESVSDRFEELTLELAKLKDSLPDKYGSPKSIKCRFKKKYNKYKPIINTIILTIMADTIVRFILSFIS